MCGFAMVIWRGSAHKPPQQGVVVGWSVCIRVGGFVLQDFLKRRRGVLTLLCNYLWQAAKHRTRQNIYSRKFGNLDYLPYLCVKIMS